MLAVLRACARLELATTQANGSAETPLAAKLSQFELEGLSDEAALVELLKAFWVAKQATLGVPARVAQSLAGAMSPEDILLQLESEL